MQFLDSSGKEVSARQPEPSTIASHAHHTLSFYTEPPSHDITLEQFERLALDRLAVLQKLRDAKEVKKETPAELQKSAETLFTKFIKEGATPQEWAQKDLVSHYILRLAYCRTPALREELLRLEADLFRARFAALPASSKVAFVREVGVGCEDLSEAEFGEVKEALAAVLAASNPTDKAAAQEVRAGTNKAFFKVPWERVYDLVQGRQVLLRKGMAYIGKEQLTSLVAGDFRSRLSLALVEMSTKLYGKFAAAEAGRLAPIVEALSARNMTLDHSMSDRAARGETITTAQVPALAARHFPLCMHNLHEHLRVEHHLKHQGRQNLNLFFKSIGLPMEEAVAYWRATFAPRTPPEAFNKQYAYGVRHNYGREGKRTEYTPHKCVTIIGQKVDPGTHHGCPYKTFSDDDLSAALRRLSCSERAISTVLQKRAGGHFQAACQSAFEGIHNCACVAGINFPNQYYDESRRVYDEREGTGTQGAGTQGTCTQGSQGTVAPGTPSLQPGAATPVTPAVAGARGAGAATPGGAASVVVGVKRPAPESGGAGTPS